MYYATGIDLIKAGFDSLSAKRLSLEGTATNNDLDFFQAKVVEIIKSLKPFSFISFEKRFLWMTSANSIITSQMSSVKGKRKQKILAIQLFW